MKCFSVMSFQLLMSPCREAAGPGSTNRNVKPKSIRDSRGTSHAWYG